MGVKGLWSELQSCGQDVALARLHDRVAMQDCAHQSPDLRLGIDIAGWIFQAHKSQGGKAPELRLLFYRFCKLLNLPYISPVFVFDGPGRPSMKRGRFVNGLSHAHNTFGPDNRLISDIKAFIDAFGFTRIDAPGEAEAELADLNRRDLLDAVMTDDVDAFVFGARVVVRFWGTELSSIKARSDYLARAGTSNESASPPLTSSEQGADSDVSSSLFREEESQVKRSVTNGKALQENSVAIFDARKIAQQNGLDIGGFILAAILSGGDYDVKGLAKCGIKIATALAKAGFGKSLYEGARKYFQPPDGTDKAQVPDNRLPSPKQRPGWNCFIDNWRENLCAELRNNTSGLLGRRYKKLSESTEMQELLTTPAALAVLSTYIWPLVSDRQQSLEPRAIDLSSLALLAHTRLGWQCAAVLETFRGKVWPGCIERLLLGQAVQQLALEDLAIAGTAPGQSISKSSPSKVAAASKNAKISSYFSKSQIEITEVGPSRSLLFAAASISKERAHPSTGFLPELRVEVEVRALANIAQAALKTSESDDEDHHPRSAPSTPQKASPRKRREFSDPHKLLRFWASKDVVLRDKSARAAYASLIKRGEEKAKRSTRGDKTSGLSSSPSKGSHSLTSFFAPGRSSTQVFRSPPLSAKLASVSTKPSEETSAGNKYTKNAGAPESISPSKRKSQSSRASPRPVRELVADWDDEEALFGRRMSPPSPTSPSKRERAKLPNNRHQDKEKEEHLANLAGGLDSKLRSKQSHGHMNDNEQLISRKDTSFADDSIEFVSQTNTYCSRAPTRPLEIVGSVTISDDSDEEA